MTGMEGRHLGAYELLGRIGGGGMAEVYRAKQLSAFGREVAIKVIRAGYSEDSSFRERFLREAQAISRLSHPNILPLIEFGEDHTYRFGEEVATLYLVMPLAREGTLRDVLQQHNGPLSLEEVVPLFTQLCDAVQYAHEEGIIHRDLKPQNVLLQRRSHVLLADFGIARDIAEAQHMTTTGAGIGTVEYMAPEQALGQATQQSDIYSLGIVLYQLVTGRVPYTGSTPFQVLTRHAQAPLPDPRLLNPGLPAELVLVLQSALAKDPQQRFASAQALGRAVQQVRPDALGDMPTRTSATQPPLSRALLFQPPLTNLPTRPGQGAQERHFEPGLPEHPDDAAPSRPGGVTRELPDSLDQQPTPGWPGAGAAEDEDDLPTLGMQGGRTAGTAAGWQQRGRSGPPSLKDAVPVPQHQSVPRRRRGLLIGTLLAALILLLLLASLGVANELGLFTGPAGSHVAQEPTTTNGPQAAGTSHVPTTGTGATTPSSTGAATPLPTGATTPLPTGTAKSLPTPTNTPKSLPTQTPTPTPNPYPNIAGNYQGSYSPLGSGISNSLTLQIVQSGPNLSGTANDNGTMGSISGSIDSSGNFTIFLPSGHILSGGIAGPGHLSGTYTNGAGEIGYWDATSS